MGFPVCRVVSLTGGSVGTCQLSSRRQKGAVASRDDEEVISTVVVIYLVIIATFLSGQIQPFPANASHLGLSLQANTMGLHPRRANFTESPVILNSRAVPPAVATLGVGDKGHLLMLWLSGRLS